MDRRQSYDRSREVRHVETSYRGGLGTGRDRCHSRYRASAVIEEAAALPCCELRRTSAAESGSWPLRKIALASDAQLRIGNPQSPSCAVNGTVAPGSRHINIYGYGFRARCFASRRNDDGETLGSARSAAPNDAGGHEARQFAIPDKGRPSLDSVLQSTRLPVAPPGRRYPHPTLSPQVGE
jgi:hypothetical protein